MSDSTRTHWEDEDISRRVAQVILRDKITCSGIAPWNLRERWQLTRWQWFCLFINNL